MDGVEPKSKRLIFVIIGVVIIAAIFYLWRYGNPLASLKSAWYSAVDIKTCDSISPQTAVVVDGDMITFQNSDVADHRIDIAGQTVTVPGKNIMKLATKFKYGTGTYGYACDGKLVANQVVIVPVPGSAAVVQIAFKALYDEQKAAVQSCLKSALGTEFDKAYGDAGYVPSNDGIGKVSDCFDSARASSQK